MSDLSEIVAQHAEAVWRASYRLLNNHEDALDCYQETFMAALRLRPEEVRNWRSVLLRIATCKAMDQLRRRYQHQAATSTLNQLYAAQPQVEPLDAHLQAEELREAIRRALVQLEPQQAEAFWLRHLEGLTPEEIAQTLNITPGYARVLVHRAAVNLRDFLGPSLGPARIVEESP